MKKRLSREISLVFASFSAIFVINQTWSHCFYSISIPTQCTLDRMIRGLTISLKIKQIYSLKQSVSLKIGKFNLSPFKIRPRLSVSAVNEHCDMKLAFSNFSLDFFAIAKPNTALHLNLVVM